MKKNYELKSIGKRLKAIRTHLGYLQRDFAAELDISPGNLSEIESGNTKPRHVVIYNLAGKYKVNIYYLLHGRGKMFISDFLERTVVPSVYGPDTEFLKEFLRYFKESSFVRYDMMGFVRKFIVENETLIEKDIKMALKEKEEKEKRKKEQQK